jgi:hypothetical protein
MPRSGFEQGLTRSLHQHVVAREGVELPSGRDVVEAGFQAAVCEHCLIQLVGVSIKQLNVAIWEESPPNPPLEPI